MTKEHAGFDHSSALDRISSFSLGVLLYFVAWEPSPFDIFAMVLICCYISPIAWQIKRPIFLSYLISQVLCLILEFAIFETFTWSAISMYLTLLMMLCCVLFKRERCLKYFLRGVLLGAILTCVAFLLIPDFHNIYDGVRLKGFFKDPNVFSSTSLAMLFLSFPLGLPVAAVYTTLVILAASRATLLSAALSIFFMKSGWSGVVLMLMLVTVAGFFYEELISVIDLIFGIMGRGGVFNVYDYDRLDNWLVTLTAWSNSFFPLGPTWSDVNGFSMHNTYLRVLLEQGTPNLICFLLLSWIAMKKANGIYIRAAIVALLINSFVIDATHWRILFIVYGLALSGANLKRYRTKQRHIGLAKP